MPGVARLNDTHKGICNHGLPCCPHEVIGTISTASGNVIVNGRGAARLNDKVIHNCPHCGTGYISSAASKEINRQYLARLGDEVTYPAGKGKIVTASENVFSGS